MKDARARTQAAGARRQSDAAISEGKSCLSYPDHLPRWKMALSQAQFRQANIAVYGNSLTDGAYANGVVAENQAVYRQRAWVPQLRQRFRSPVLPEVGEGFIGCNDARVTAVGTLAIPSTGITRSSGGLRINNTGQSITIVTTDPCNEFWIHGWWESDAKCAPFIYTVDGGGDQTATAVNALGTDKDYTFKITGLSTGSHTIVIKPAATPTKQIDIAGFSSFLTAGATAGVAVHRCGKGGGYIDNFFFPSNDSANPRSARLTLGRLNADLAILQFYTNEVTSGGEAVGWSPRGQGAKNFYTFTKDVVNMITGTYGVDVLLCSLTLHQNGLGSYTEQAYLDVQEQIASENPNCAHFNLARLPRWSSWAAANANGLMIDGIHSPLKGHSDISRLLYEAVSI